MSGISAFTLDGRVAVVTGGASGIGEGIARVLAGAGATVVIADRDADRGRAVAETLGGGFVPVDLASEESIVAACAAIVDRFGGPWALVNNAGVQDRELLLEGTAAEWDRTLAINARAPFLMSRELAHAMIAKGEGGRIVHVGSMATEGALTQGHAAYASSKSALFGLARASALELLPHRITVNVVLPGGVITPGAMTARGPEPIGPGRRPPPLGLSKPEDIGAAVAFFASPAAGQITNQSVAVDGGWSVS